MQRTPQVHQIGRCRVRGPGLPCDSTFTQPEATATGSVPERKTGREPPTTLRGSCSDRVIDIAGVPITLHATDDERGAVLDAR